MSEKHIGKVLQVIGPVLDIQFEDGQLPELLNAIEIDNHGEKLVVEVAQHTGDNVVRCIAMNSTDGLVRGTEAVDTGEPENLAHQNREQNRRQRVGGGNQRLQQMHDRLRQDHPGLRFDKQIQRMQSRNNHQHRDQDFKRTGDAGGGPLSADES